MKLKVLVLGADTFQIGLLKFLNEKGFETHVVTNRPNDPGVAYANVCHEFSYTDVAAVWQLYQTINAVQIFSVASDASTYCQSIIQQKAGVAGHLPELIQLFTDKSLYKIKLRELLPQHIPDVKVCVRKDDLVEFFQQYNTTGVVVKPRVGSGSKDVGYVQSVIDATNYRWKEEADAYLMEEFIPGKEFGGDFFCHAGKVVFFAPTLKAVNQHHVPVSHLMLDLPLQELEAMTGFLQQVVHALMLPDGIYNVDLILKQASLYLIDISPRMGGNCIPDITSLSTGVNPWAFLLNLLLQEPILNIEPNPMQPHGVFILGANEEACITSRVTTEHPFGDNIVEVFWKKKEGDWVEPFTQGGKHLGYIIFKAENNEELQSLLQQIRGFNWFTLSI